MLKFNNNHTSQPGNWGQSPTCPRFSGWNRLRPKFRRWSQHFPSGSGRQSRSPAFPPGWTCSAAGWTGRPHRRSGCSQTAPLHHGSAVPSAERARIYLFIYWRLIRPSQPHRVTSGLFTFFNFFNFFNFTIIIIYWRLSYSPVNRTWSPQGFSLLLLFIKGL